MNANTIHVVTVDGSFAEIAADVLLAMAAAYAKEQSRQATIEIVDPAAS